MNGATSYAEAAFGRAGEGGERVLPENFPVGMRVLLVDDDVTCLAVVKGMLLKCKYEVTTCSQATKALSLLRENKNAFDIILSDVHMPDMDGFRLLELVGLEMDLPVIMMSADTRFNIVMKGIKHGACDFLIKPVRMAELQNLWQHLVRRKCHDNREPEHSGSLDESDRGKQIDDYEYGTATNDGSDGSWRSQKKKRDIKEEEDGELDSTDPSSSKKPRVVWSVELHQQFVNAVNQLGIDKAVPKRILELMNVPGLTRENVASHLQKFRLYLKRLSGVVQHHAGLANSLSGGSANAKVDHLGSLDFQTLAVTGQIPPQTLAVLQDELLGRPRNLSMPANAIDQTILRQASVQGNRSVTVEQGISFGQPLLNGQGVSFPMWSSNNLGSMVSPSNAGSINSSQDTNILATMLQQQQPHPVLESHRAANVQPSCLLSPAQSSQRFHIQTDPIFSNQDCLVSPSQRSNSFNMGNSVIPMNQNSVLLSSQSSTNLQTGNSVILLNKNSTMVPSQSLPNMSGGKNPGYLHQNTSIAPSQPFTNFQTGMTQLPTGPNSLIPSYQSPSTFQSKHNLDHVTHNPSFNDSSSIVDYDQLSSEFNIVGQVLDGDFSNSALVDSYSSLGSISSIDGSSNQQLHSADGSFSHPNASMYVVPHSFNAQNGNIVTEDLSDQNKRRNLGFVGKGTRLPSRFVVDDMEAPSNVLTHGNMYINDDEYLLNQDIFGSNGTLQNGRCASTSFK